MKNLSKLLPTVSMLTRKLLESYFRYGHVLKYKVLFAMNTLVYLYQSF